MSVRVRPQALWKEDLGGSKVRAYRELIGNMNILHEVLLWGIHMSAYPGLYFGFFELAEYAESVMGTTEPAKSKLFRRVRRPRRDCFTSA